MLLKLYLRSFSSLQLMHSTLLYQKSATFDNSSNIPVDFSLIYQRIWFCITSQTTYLLNYWTLIGLEIVFLIKNDYY